MSATQLLTANDREALAQLQLLARGVVEGVSSGRHRSPHKGTSAEFREHRQYVRGDEYRSVDWKLYGKTDRLYIRQFDDETSLRAMILLDQSGSMKYSGSRAEGVSKHDFAVRLAACIATQLFSQQDSVGLATFDSELRQFITPRSNTSHLRTLCEVLVQSRPGSETSLGDAMNSLAGRLKGRGVVLLISDMFDSVERIASAFKRFRSVGTEVIVFQVRDPDELDFPFRSRTEFRSLENKGARIVDAHAVRSAYLKRIEEFQSQLAAALSQEAIELVSCVTSDSYSEVLARYITKRAQGIHRGQSRQSAVKAEQFRGKAGS